VLQVFWVARLALPEGAGLVAFFVLVALELSVPVWAEARGRTTWHPRHIAERYGLFTIIVLGESVLAATIGVQTALDLDAHFEDVAPVVVGGLFTLFAMWWIYFDMPTERLVERARESSDAGRSGAFAWGYGHYFVFSAAAAMGAGLVIAVDQATDHSELTDAQAGLTFTLPVIVFLLMVWMLHAPYKVSTPLRNFGVPVAACLILLASFTPEPVLISGFVLVALVAASVASQPHLG
jgi:low temperature requirement protein LtrA